MVSNKLPEHGMTDSQIFFLQMAMKDVPLISLCSIRRRKVILLVQIYVDDIIFCSTKDKFCKEFEELMKSEFVMSMMGELTFFLGL